jgi:hypothetical protein
MTHWINIIYNYHVSTATLPAALSHPLKSSPTTGTAAAPPHAQRRASSVLVTHQNQPVRRWGERRRRGKAVPTARAGDHHPFNVPPVAIPAGQPSARATTVPPWSSRGGQRLGTTPNQLPLRLAWPAGGVHWGIHPRLLRLAWGMWQPPEAACGGGSQQHQQQGQATNSPAMCLPWPLLPAAVGEKHDRAALVVPWCSMPRPCTTPNQMPWPSRRENGEKVALRGGGETRRRRRPCPAKTAADLMRENLRRRGFGGKRGLPEGRAGGGGWAAPARGGWAWVPPLGVLTPCQIPSSYPCHPLLLASTQATPWRLVACSMEF